MSRDAFVQAALAVVGLSANPAGNRKEYLAAVAPKEPWDMQMAMAKMSGCALVVASIWRSAGVKHSKLDSRYKIGDAITRLMNIAYESKAWIPYSPGLTPGPGDMVLVGNNASGGAEHVFTVISIEMDLEHSEDGRQYGLTSVDGGQRDAHGYQSIYQCYHQWEGRKDRHIFPDGTSGAPKQIQGWIDCTKLPNA